MRIVKSTLSARVAQYLVLGAAVLFCAPGVAQAQERRVFVNVGGGPTFIAGDLGKRFDNGFGPAVGVTFDINPKIGVQFEYAFRRFHAENYVDFFGGTYTGYHDTHQLAFDLVFNVNPRDSKARIYIIAGPGVYHRSVTITEYLGTGIVCDPFWYICGSYPITGIVGDRGGWDFGFNVGAGVGFKMGEVAEFTIESRYHWVQGPEITNGQDGTPITLPSGVKAGSTTGHYIPLTFGFRF